MARKRVKTKEKDQLKNLKDKSEHILHLLPTVQFWLSNCVAEIVNFLPQPSCSPIQPQLHRQIHEIGRKKWERIRSHEKNVRVRYLREQSEDARDEQVRFPEGGYEHLSGTLHLEIWFWNNRLHFFSPSSRQLDTLFEFHVTKVHCILTSFTDISYKMCFDSYAFNL